MKKNVNAPKTKERGMFSFHFSFYKRFPIPWWLFILNTLLGMANTELNLYLAKILISVQKGELYNSVILTYCLMYVGHAVLAWIVNLFYYHGTAKVILRARYVIWKHILHLPVKDIEREQPASLISAQVNDSGVADQTIGYIFLMINALYSFVRAMYTMFTYNATLSMYMLLTIPLAVLVFWFVGRTQALANKKQRVALNDMTMYFAEHISAAKYVKATGMEEKEIAEGNKTIAKRFKAGVIYELLIVSQQLAFSLYRNTAIVMMVLFGSDLIRKGQMEKTGLTDFDAYKNKVDEYTSLLLTDWSVFKGSHATLGRVSYILDLPIESPDKGEDFVENENKDVIFENVHFSYVPETEVLHGVSLRIPAGKTTAIIGDNGCGKSTLLKLMQGFYTPDSGTITVAGNDVGNVSLHQLRRRMGYVLQNSELFAASLKDNMTYGATEEISDEALRQIGEKACLNEVADALENGYDTVIAEGGGSLSGGQRQRIAIARAMLLKPEYLLLDEAGSALDYQTYAKIQSAMKQEMQGKTTVFIAHDMREIMMADYVIVMNKGHVEAAGTHEELTGTSATYTDYLSKLQKKEVTA